MASEDQYAEETTDEATEEEFSYCDVREEPERVFEADVDIQRAGLIRVLENKWVNGTILHYYFFDRESDGENVVLRDGSREWRSWVGGEGQIEVVKKAFEVWKDVGIGLEFAKVESRDDAEIRIGFMSGNGSWSYIGNYILNIGANRRTMNFGWDLTRRSSEIDTAVHEIGHTLGFPHEHQNPNAGIVWDEEAVYRALGRPPNNWARSKTFHNIIRKIAPDTVQGSSWDPNSIMHYPFGRGLIDQPAQYRNGLSPDDGLSPRDETWVKTFYPELEPQIPELTPFRSEFLDIAEGEQKNFTISPTATRSYTIRTFGVSDTVMVLFEDIDGELRFQAGDDDSGQNYNANLDVRLLKGHRYVLRIRLYWSDVSGQTAVLMW